MKLLYLALDAEAAMWDMSKWYLLDDDDLYAMSESANVKADSLPWTDCTVTSVVIEEGVTSIGVGAFMGCDQLKSVTIADSVTRIGMYAFTDCAALEGVKLPENLESIEKYAFAHCEALESAEIPKNVKSIEMRTFYFCTGLKNVTIPEGVEKIGVDAFFGCTSLKSVTVPESVEEIEARAFAACGALESLTLQEGLRKIGSMAFLACSALEDVTIPAGTEKIGSAAFSWCSSLKSVAIPKSVTRMGLEAFAECDSLTRVTMPAGVPKQIKELVFGNCDAAENIECSEKDDAAIAVNLEMLLWMDDAPYTKGEQIFVPMRAILEAMNFSVEWNNDERSVTALRGEDVIKLAIGESVIYVNGAASELDAAFEITNGRTYAPIEAIEAFVTFSTLLEDENVISIVE